MSKNPNRLFGPHMDPDLARHEWNRLYILGPALGHMRRAAWAEDPEVAHQAAQQAMAERSGNAVTVNEAASLASLAVNAVAEGRDVLQATSPEVMSDRVADDIRQDVTADDDDRQVPLLEDAA